MSVETPSLDSIFCAAVEIASADERAAYVARVCGGDAELRASVERLVAAHFRAGNFLGQPALAATGPLAAPPSDAPAPVERPGTVIGPYKLLESIGEGGMGSVFMAQQTEPARRLVAVKLIKAGMDSRQVLARFQAERQALALMDHPNIAKVLDAGATEAGRPFFVMELVKGVPITKFCDERRLTPRQRLELFVPVCQAIQHAHQKGVIHRDIKPSNVLVALYDDKPVPKVIDFGVAKAAGPQLMEHTLATGFGAVIGTLEYMSPEQASFNALDVDTRSDVYALGVLLYELLTGTPPLDRKRVHRAALGEALRLVREEEALKPSARLSTSDALPSVAANRQMEPAKLSRLLRGELDWVVLKALEKDRSRRYETANGLARDVGRCLADEVVEARPPSAGYRLRKFARRNRTALAVAGLILLCIALVGGVGGWAVRDRTAREQEAAKERSNREQRLTAQVELILEDVDRLEREQKWPEAQAAAERAGAALAGGEAGDAIRLRVADAQRDLAFVAELDRIRNRNRWIEGRFDSAGQARDFSRAFREYGVDVEQLPAEAAVAALQAKPALAAPLAAALDRWVENRRGIDQGEASWKPLVAVARELNRDPLRDRLRTIWDGGGITPEIQVELMRLAESIDVKAAGPTTVYVLAKKLMQCQLPDAAIVILREGQRAYPANVELNGMLGQLVGSRQENHADSIRFLSVALSLRPDSAVYNTNLGYRLAAAGKQDEAAFYFEKAVELDPKFAELDANSRNALLPKQKRGDAALERRKAIELNPKYLTIHYYFAGTLAARGRLDEAAAECRIVSEIDPTSALGHDFLGNLLSRMGRTEEAITEFKEVIRLQEGRGDPYSTHDQVLLLIPDDDKALQKARCDANSKLALLLAAAADSKLRDGAEALKLARKAVELGPNNSLAWQALGWAQYSTGAWKDSIDAFHKSMDLQENPKGGASGQWFGLAAAHWQPGHKGEARQWYDQAVQWMERNGPQNAELRRYRAEAEQALGIQKKR